MNNDGLAYEHDGIVGDVGGDYTVGTNAAVVADRYFTNYFSAGADQTVVADSGTTQGFRSDKHVGADGDLLVDAAVFTNAGIATDVDTIGAMQEIDGAVNLVVERQVAPCFVLEASEEEGGHASFESTFGMLADAAEAPIAT